MFPSSMWHTSIPSLDMTTAAALRSMRAPTHSNSLSPEKVSLFNGNHSAFSVNTLLNQTSPDHFRLPSSAAAAAAAAAVVQHHHHLFSTLFHHYPYAAPFRPLLNGPSPAGLLTSSISANSSLSSSIDSSPSSSSSSAFLPAGKRFKSNNHDERHCDVSPSDKSSEENFHKSSENCSRRTSNVDLQNPHCPICQTSLNQQEMVTHIKEELETLERTTTEQIRQQSKSSSRFASSAHVSHKNLQENLINNFDQTFKTRYETYVRVRSSRQQRLNAKLPFHHRRVHRTDSRHCPICYQMIPFHADEEYFFTHVQQCSRKREQLAANAALATLTNQHRVSISTTDDPDINVVDMDDPIETEDNQNHRPSTTETTSTTDQSDDRCPQSSSSDQKFSPPNQSNDLLYSSSSNVSELNPPKCVVCMEFCVKPCVSLRCWHINCEECWSKYLTEKHSCPQCHLATSSDHLRRIYFNQISN